MTDNKLVFSDALTRTVAGALAIAFTFVTVSAAKAETGKAFRSSVEASIDRELVLPSGVRPGSHGVATLAVTIDADGKVQSAKILKSSGYAAYDKAAVRTAHQVSYPATGKERTVAMVLGYHQKVTAADQRTGRELVTAYMSDPEVMLADKTTAQQPDS